MAAPATTHDDVRQLERLATAVTALREQVSKRIVGQQAIVDGVLTVSSQEERSQLRNREIALKRLADILATAVAPPPPRRRPTRATRASMERRLADKRRRAKIKRLRRPDED